MFSIMKTEYITLTELWRDGYYSEVGRIINTEQWTASQLAAFCFYFAKYIGLNDLEVLHKFL